jgi:purine-binding chemotaxis protein CheW
MSERTREPVPQIVGFSIGDEEFGVDILRVQEINSIPSVTRIPDVPDYIEGVMEVHGKAIPVVNLRRRFGMPRKEWDKNSRILVVEFTGKQIGFVVDAVQEVLRVPESVKELPASFVGSVKAEYVSAVGRLKDRQLILLDLEKVLIREGDILKRVR